MEFLAVMEFLIRAFQRENIDFAVIGGLALQAAGVTRTTCDIDVLILREDKEKVKETMFRQGYELLHESEDVINFYGQRVELGRVDCLLAHRKYAVAMLGRAEQQEVFGGKFKMKVVRIEDQIGLKVQSSSNDPRRLYQDMADIESLVKIHSRRLDLELVREYFMIFGREEELDAALKRIRDAEQ
jgi:predicted nucleotidyltransferase